MPDHSVQQPRDDDPVREIGVARPLVTDPTAESADPCEPAFIARPAGAPVYHGFPIDNDVVVDGFRLGAITEFGAGVRDGDAFLVAPDGSRAGLIWEVGSDDDVREVRAVEQTRWGVWEVEIPCEVVDQQTTDRVLRHLVRLLKPRWERWSSTRA